ncbi:MAG: c-type cytochrome [Lysobacterales bacterium]
MLGTRVFVFILATVCAASAALATADPAKRRHELMEEVGDAAKPVGKMLRGERAFDAAIALQSFETMRDVAAVVGDLFPEGSYSGDEDTAKETVWSDREGFNKRLSKFTDDIAAAIAANPQSLETFEPVASAVFRNCKACHEEYRIPGD